MQKGNACSRCCNGRIIHDSCINCGFEPQYYHDFRQDSEEIMSARDFQSTSSRSAHFSHPRSHGGVNRSY